LLRGFFVPAIVTVKGTTIKQGLAANKKASSNDEAM
jgi:hypothetical protein